MIFVAAGTQDGRELVQQLLADGHHVLASVVSEYGKILLSDHENLQINENPLDLAGLKTCIQKNSIEIFVDASHPYAINVSKNAMESCQELGILYIRYEREASELPGYDRFYMVKDYHEAAKKAVSFGKNIFLTTGSRNLGVLKKEEAFKDCRLIARVLPEVSVLKECHDLGFMPKDIIALQGPFSKELNKELYIKYDADVILTKNSGKIGGTDTKIAAAIELGLPVVMIDRPRLLYPQMAQDYPAVLAFVKKYATK